MSDLNKCSRKLASKLHPATVAILGCFKFYCCRTHSFFYEELLIFSTLKKYSDNANIWTEVAHTVRPAGARQTGGINLVWFGNRTKTAKLPPTTFTWLSHSYLYLWPAGCNLIALSLFFSQGHFVLRPIVLAFRLQEDIAETLGKGLWDCLIRFRWKLQSSTGYRPSNNIVWPLAKAANIYIYNIIWVHICCWLPVYPWRRTVVYVTCRWKK